MWIFNRSPQTELFQFCFSRLPGLITIASATSDFYSSGLRYIIYKLETIEGGVWGATGRCITGLGDTIKVQESEL